MRDGDVRADEGRMPRSWIAYPAITGCIGLAYLFGPDVINVGPVFNALGASAALAIIWGARRNLERGRLPWYLFAAGQLLFVTGDVLAYNYDRLFGREVTFPSSPIPSISPSTRASSRGC